MKPTSTVPGYRILGNTPDGDLSETIVVCVNDGAGRRVHLKFNWSPWLGYDWKEGWDFWNYKSGNIEFSPCTCEEHKEEAPPWMALCLKRYHEEQPGAHCTLETPVKKDAPEWEWIKKNQG
ncbi:MAG: hypothetical protein WCV84_02835 [Patescibacteria group bacterium]